MLCFLVLRKIGKTELSRQQMLLNAAAPSSQREIEKRRSFNQESRCRQSFENEITTPHGSLFERLPHFSYFVCESCPAATAATARTKKRIMRLAFPNAR